MKAMYARFLSPPASRYMPLIHRRPIEKRQQGFKFEVELQAAEVPSTPSVNASEAQSDPDDSDKLA